MDIAELPREVEKLDRDWIVATLSSGILSDGREVDGVRYMMPNAECLWHCVGIPAHFHCICLTL